MITNDIRMWRIYYADGSIFDHSQGNPEDVPGHGVQVIVQPDRMPGVGNVGYTTLRGYDWWYWRLDSEEWLGCMGDASIFDLILHREPITGICQGRRIPHDLFQAILADAEKWAKKMSIPAKSGYRTDERS